MAFEDYEGSRYTGAARSSRHRHVHGTLLLPHFARDHLEEIAQHLLFVAQTFLGILVPRHEVEIRPFKPAPDAFLGGLVSWISYGAKDALRRVDGSGMHFLPFDVRHGLMAVGREAMLRNQERYIACFQKAHLHWAEGQGDATKTHPSPQGRHVANRMQSNDPLHVETWPLIKGGSAPKGHRAGPMFVLWTQVLCFSPRGRRAGDRRRLRGARGCGPSGLGARRGGCGQRQCGGVASL